MSSEHRGNSIFGGGNKRLRLRWVKVSSVEDIFITSLNLEETRFNVGYKSGYINGISFGKDIDRHVGLKLSFKTDQKLDFYRIDGIKVVSGSYGKIEHNYKYPLKKPKLEDEAD